jgi:serine protease Do
MENYENEVNQQTEAQPEVTAQAQPQPETQQSAYHGAGVGQRETPFTNTPYGTVPGYQPYRQPAGQPWEPWNQPRQTPAKPTKAKKVMGKVFKAVACCVLTAVLVATGCGITANLCNRYWKQQNALILQNMNDKVAALQQQINDQKQDTQIGGVLEPGQTLTAAQIYQQNVNSVVAITCTVRQTSGGQVLEGRNAGTGFIITEDGYIVTNHHVIQGASKITVTMADGREFLATLVGSNDTNDIAVIKLINAVGLKPVKLGTSSGMQVGDQVVAIGNALGELSASLTVGYVSGIDRGISTDGTVINMIQTDAAINSGNSGGPLFNAKGEVIGITTAKYSGTTSSGASIEGISFAIPLDDVIDMIEDLRDYGYIRSAYLGVMVWEVDAQVAETYNLPLGVYVEDVTPGACAAEAGVHAKDIIVELGGYTIHTMNDLSRALRAFEAGETVSLVVWRAGQYVILSVTLDAKPAQ